MWLEEEPPPVDNFEEDLEAVDVVSFPLPLSTGFEELLFVSIPMPTSLSLCEEDKFVNQLIQGTNATVPCNIYQIGGRGPSCPQKPLVIVFRAHMCSRTHSAQVSAFAPCLCRAWLSSISLCLKII